MTKTSKAREAPIVSRSSLTTAKACSPLAVVVLGILLQALQGRALANSLGIFQADSNGLSPSNTGPASSAGPGGTSSIAIGINAQVVQPTGSGDGIAIGTDVSALNQDAIAIGAQTVASGYNTIAIGNNFTAASGNNADVFGVGAVGSGDGSSVFGNFASVNSTNGSAFGFLSQVTAVGGSALGAASSVTSAYGTALGFGSVANRAGLNGNEAFSNAAVASPYGALSIGSAGAERQIQNVAGGTQDTDAVNVRQLRGVGQNAATALGGGASYGTSSNNYAYTAPSYTVGGQTYHDVASAMSASNNLAVQYTPDGSGNPTNTVDLTKGGTISATTITGLAPATTGSGAVSLSQLPLQYSTSGAPTTANPATASNDVTLIGTSGQPVALHNVAPGALSATSTDSVDGQQLYTTNQNVTSLRGSFDTLTGNSTTTPGVKYFRANSTGPDSSATGTDAIAVGTSSSALGTNSIAIGVNSSASGTNSLALGSAAGATGGYATAVGLGTSAQSQGSAFGEGANAGSTAVAAGFLASASGVNSTAIGGTANSAGEYSLAAGTSAYAAGVSSTALGNAAVATGAQSAAVGGAAVATGAQSVALGGADVTNSTPGAQAVAAKSVAIGSGSVANNASDVALGAFSTTATAVGTGGATIGGTAYTFAGTTPSSTVSVGAPGAERTITNVAAGRLSGTSTDAVNGSELFATDQAVSSLRGSFDTLTGNSTTTPGVKYFRANSTGPDASATGTDAIAVGTSSSSSGPASIAVGANSSATGTSSVAIGSNAAALGGYGTAVGLNASTQGAGSAFGLGATAASTALAAGYFANASGGSGTALGATTKAIGTFSLAAGTSASASGRSSTALGNDANATGAQSVAIGGSGGTSSANAAQALAANAVSIGYKSTANNAGDVALGANSMTAGAVGTGGATIGGTAYTFAGTTPSSTVSVGAPGAERTVTNLAAGSLSGTSTDAVNGSELYATDLALSGLRGALDGGTEGLVQQNPATQVITVGAATGGTVVNFTNGSGIARTLTGVAAGALSATSTDATNGAQLYATNQQVASLQAGTAGLLRQDPTTRNLSIGGATNGTLVDLTNSAGATRALSGVTAGSLSSTSTQAVNGSQLYATDQALAALQGGANGLVQQNPMTRDLSVGANTDGTNVSFANASGTARSLLGVAAGQIASGSTQAVNGGQAYNMAASAASAFGGGAMVNSDGTISAPTYTVQGSQYSSVGGAIGGLDAAVSNINTHGSMYFAVNTTGGAASATGLDTVAVGPNASATADRGIALGANSVASRAGLSGAREMFSGTSVSSTAGAVSVGTTGAERQITNVAGGTAPTDAVNVRQLTAVNQQVANVLGGGASLASDGSLQAPSYSIDGKQYASVGSALAAVDTTAVKYDIDPTTGARGNSIALQGGDPNQPVLIRNVAAGQQATDAANTGQVNAAKAAAFAYTDASVAGVEQQLGGVNQQLANLQSQINQTRMEARQGAAIGLAAAALRYDDRPGKVSAAVGQGVWKGQVASALGIGYTLPGGWGRFNANGVTTGRDFGVGAGASFTLN